MRRTDSSPFSRACDHVPRPDSTEVTGPAAVRLTPEQARARLVVLSRWATHSPMAGDVLAASAISEDNGISFWDAMIVRSASELGCPLLWTQDLNHGQVIAGVRIANPFADH